MHAGGKKGRSFDRLFDQESIGPQTPVFPDAVMGVKRRNRMKKGIPTRMTVVLLAAAIAVCAFGAFRGELDIVMAKAINICMECIGLG